MHLVILLFALFASMFTLQKGTLNFAEPFFLIGSRMTFAGVILLLYAFLCRKERLQFKPSHLQSIVILALINIYLTNIFEIWAIKHMASSKACLIYSISPFIAAGAAFFILKERLSAKKWLGMLVGFIGLLPIMLLETGEELLSGTFMLFSMAELSLLAAVIFSVCGWIVLKKVLQFGYSPIMANGLSMTMGGVLALGHSLLSGEIWQPIPVSNMQLFVTNSLLMCLISNVICYNLYGYLLKRFSATFMAFAGLVTPFFASLFGYIFLDEIITWHFVASLIMFAVGLAIFHQEETKVKQPELIKSS